MKEFTQREYEELDEYVELEGTEIGEYLNTVMCLWNFANPYGERKGLQKAIDIELWHWLKRFRRETQIIKTTFIREPIIHKELEWF